MEINGFLIKKCFGVKGIDFFGLFKWIILIGCEFK